MVEKPSRKAGEFLKVTGTSTFRYLQPIGPIKAVRINKPGQLLKIWGQPHWFIEGRGNKRN
jgi:hypothetical protein